VKREIPGGPLFEVPDMESIPGMLRRAARLHPGRTAVTEPPEDGGGCSSMDYSSLLESVESLARGILSLCGSRPVVGIAGRNSTSWCRAYLAALTAGGVAVPIDREIPFEEMYSILRRSGAGAVFFDRNLDAAFSAPLPGELSSVVRIGMDEGIAGVESIAAVESKGAGSGAQLPPEPDSAATSVICYTSGTTGRSKGVMLTQGNLVSDIRQMYQFVDIRPDDVFLSVMPFHHTYECTCGFLGPLSLGASVYICRGLRYVMEDLAASRATVILGVPLLWEAVYRRVMQGVAGKPGGRLKFALGMALAGIGELLGREGVRRNLFSAVHDRFGGSLRLMISGGAAIDPAVVKGFEKMGFGFLQGYGLTETSPLVSVNRIGGNRYGSVGIPLPDMDVEIREPDGSGIGEITVRGPNVMAGYHDDPEATSAVLSPEGWFRTGDFGYLDRDGYLWVTGRKKNVIVAKNGKNVFPEEIESVLNRAAAIAESMVFGMASERKGEEVRVVAVPDGDVIPPGTDQVNAVRQVIRKYNSTTAPYRRISAFLVREEELPRTTTRKIRRRDVFPGGYPPDEDFVRV
jgi:long-chain acyl-CoA synthetase